MANIQQIIGKICPSSYAENGKELLRKYGNIENIPADEVVPKSLSDHSIIYDSSTETLEPMYFFVLDLLDEFSFDAEKIIDNFSSTPGSGHFSELGQRATIMQQQGAKIMADVNTVLRSVLNLIYDLKEFRTRLQAYTDLDSKDKGEGALLSLKQIWLDKVDYNKGNSSVKAMSFQGGFQTLIDAFLVAKDENLKDVNGKEIDLNERVKRILKPRLKEFNIWIKESERELRKRYELEKNYLRSQVNSLKLYSRWVKPYLKAAKDLEPKDRGKEPSLVKMFNTILLELTLLGKSEVDVQKAAIEGILPEDFQKLETKRGYFECVLVEFKFRGIPQKVMQQAHYAFGGKAEIKFSAYALNSEEIDKINQEVDKSDVEDVLGLIEGATTGSLEQMQEEIDSFLEEKDETTEKEKQIDGSNPFLALIGSYNKKPEKSQSESEQEKSKQDVIVRPENWIEKTHIRKLTEEKARDDVFELFDVYKKSHGMPSYT